VTSRGATTNGQQPPARLRGLRSTPHPDSRPPAPRSAGGMAAEQNGVMECWSDGVMAGPSRTGVRNTPILRYSITPPPHQETRPMFVIDAHLDLAMNALAWNRDLELNVPQTRALEAGMTQKGRACGTVALPEMRRGHIGICVATVIARVHHPGNPLPGCRAAEIAYAHAQGQPTTARWRRRASPASSGTGPVWRPWPGSGRLPSRGASPRTRRRRRGSAPRSGSS
jgi:hypothetical protein